MPFVGLFVPFVAKKVLTGNFASPYSKRGHE